MIRRTLQTISSLTKTGIKVCSSKYLGQKHPLFLIFELTYRCNLSCAYCNRSDVFSLKEADTIMFCRIIAEAKKMGLLRVYLTGGEVLLREDLDQIIACCKRLGIMVELWTNGSLVVRRYPLIKLIDGVTFSLDGPADIHDSLRGKTSFDSTMAAASYAKKYNVPISFNFTQTKYNIGSFVEALRIACSFGATITFQPVWRWTGNSERMLHLFPTQTEFQRVLQEVFILKNRYPQVIENSYQHVQYLQAWPFLTKFPCLHGVSIFTVRPDATLVVCMNSDSSRLVSVDLKKYSFAEALQRIPPGQCRGCVCAGAYDAGGSGGMLPIRWDVFKMHIMRKWNLFQYT